MSIPQRDPDLKKFVVWDLDVKYFERFGNHCSGGISTKLGFRNSSASALFPAHVRTFCNMLAFWCGLGTMSSQLKCKKVQNEVVYSNGYLSGHMNQWLGG